jgi:hypothetical protein
MSSKKNPHIKKVKLKVLEIQETPCGEPAEPVVVELTRGDPIGSVTSQSGQTIPIFVGEMTYQRPGSDKKKKVDMVDAVFVADEGETSEPGNIVLKVNLTQGNTFTPPLVTTVPSDETSVPTHCVDIKESGEAQITISFMEPAKGEFVSYPALYFHTADGIIDPGIGVRRKPD